MALNPQSGDGGFDSRSNLFVFRGQSVSLCLSHDIQIQAMASEESSSINNCGSTQRKLSWRANNSSSRMILRYFHHVNIFPRIFGWHPISDNSTAPISQTRRNQTTLVNRRRWPCHDAHRAASLALSSTSRAKTIGMLMLSCFQGPEA